MLNPAINSNSIGSHLKGKIRFSSSQNLYFFRMAVHTDKPKVKNEGRKERRERERKKEKQANQHIV